MSTIHLPLSRNQLLPGDPSGSHALWDEAFDSQTQHDLIAEDLDAGRTVCGVLISIVVGGLLLGIVAVLLSL